MKNLANHIIVFLIFIISYSTSAYAQGNPPQAPEVPTTAPATSPSTTNPTANTPTVNNNQPVTTTEPIYVPIEQPRKRRRRRVIVVPDSVRLAAQQDSLAKVAQLQNVNGTTLGANSMATKADSSTKHLTTTTIVSEVPILETSTNPFEILRGGGKIDSVPNTTKSLEQAAPSLLNKETYSKNFLFWVFLVTLALMALVVANGQTAIRDAYQALLSNNALRQIYRQQAGWGNISQLALYILFVINGSIFAFLMLYHFLGKPPANQLFTFACCLGGVGLVYFVKHAILYVISVVFPITKEIKLYNFIIITAGILLGLILLPLNIFIAYSPPSLSDFLTYTAILCIATIYLVRSLRSLSVATPFFVTDQFHFLLYLCAVEIAPLLILVKVLMMNSII